jgi:hypothetical protein
LRQRLGIGRRRVAAAEGLDADLAELGRAILALAEDRAEIAELRRPAGVGGGEIVERDRNREIGPQAQLAARRVADEIHAPADVLAREIEERLGRLQDRGRDARIPGALIGGDERFRARVLRRLAHGLILVPVQFFQGRPCSTRPLAFR